MKDYPLIKVTIFFIAGIIIQSIVRVEAVIVYCLLISLVIIAAAFYFFLKGSAKSFSISLILLTAIGLCGMLILSLSSPPIRFIKLGPAKSIKIAAAGSIDNLDLIKHSEVTFSLDCDSITLNGLSRKLDLKLLCKIKGEDKAALALLYKKLSPGNYVKVAGEYSRGRGKRNPGEFDYAKYLTTSGFSGTLNTYNVKDVEVLAGGKNLFKTFFTSLRKQIDKSISNLHDKKTSALLRSLLLADKGEIDNQVKEEFINSGVIHVLAVSGLHVGYIILIFLLVLGRFNIYIKSVITILGLLLFMFLTGVPPSVFRATMMSIIAIAAVATNRQINTFNTISAAALIILLIRPEDLFSPGFQLSFSAVLGIIIITPPLQQKINILSGRSKALKYLMLFFAVSFSAQIGTLPFTLIYFGKLSMIALLANLIVIPVIGVIVGIGIFTLFVNFVSVAIASIYATVNNLITGVLFSVIKALGRFEYAYLPIRNFSILDAVLFYFSLGAAGYCLIKFKSRKAKFIVIGLLLANYYVISSLDSKEIFDNEHLNLLMIDVGQGDSFLVRFPGGQTLLIDAGDATINFDNGERIIKPLLNYLGIEKIGYAFVSHLDSDHYGGFVSLIHDDRIARIYKPPADSTEKDKRFENFLKEKKIPFSYYRGGLFKIGGGRLYIISDDDLFNRASMSSNNRSGVLKLTYGKNSFLFMGDAERKAEDYYISKYSRFLNVDVLKVSHHGSKTSTSEKFLNYTTPKVSLISAGVQNKFNLPSPEIIKRLDFAGSKILRTDSAGAVLIRSDGSNISVIDWRKLE